MPRADTRIRVTQSIEHAVAHLAEALEELDRISPHDPAAAGFVAHAVNNYLSVSDATLGLMRNALADHPNPEVMTWIDGLHHLGTLIQHALERLLRGSAPAGFPMKPEAINLPLLMERACNYYQGAAAKKQLRIVCRSVSDIPLVWADRVAVAVVADNLLSNAVKFSNPGGDIFVQIVAGPGGVVCSVLDHGPGLTPLEQARLFAPGSTVGPRPTAGEPSSGFGLAIAKEFIDRMGGKLWSEAETGRGACFYFRLPYYVAGSPGAQ
jgi:signal transduction histidine kinase